jgi:hypothetical protein
VNLKEAISHVPRLKRVRFVRLQSPFHNAVAAASAIQLSAAGS